MTDYDNMSLEDLKNELEGLKKENMIAELEAQKAKVEERKKAEQEAEQEKLRNEIRQDLLKEMKGESKVDDAKDKITNESNSSKWMNFKEEYVKDNGLKGLSYEEIAHRKYRDSLKRGY
jgi:hypothetical protein